LPASSAGSIRVPIVIHEPLGRELLHLSAERREPLATSLQEPDALLVAIEGLLETEAAFLKLTDHLLKTLKALVERRRSFVRPFGATLRAHRCIVVRWTRKSPSARSNPPRTAARANSVALALSSTSASRSRAVAGRSTRGTRRRTPQ